LIKAAFLKARETKKNGGYVTICVTITYKETNDGNSQLPKNIKKRTTNTEKDNL